MRVLELHEYCANGDKEYVVVSEISNWFGNEIDDIETYEEEVRTGLFGTKVIKETHTRKVGTRMGSTIYMKNGKETYVYESPSEILQMLMSNNTINLGEQNG